MANEKNLKPVRTKSEARERGKKGGEASGRSRREKKTIQNILTTFLNDEIKGNARLEELAEKAGVETDSSRKELFTIVGVLNTLSDCNLGDLEKMMKLLGEDKDSSGDGLLSTLFDDFEDVR